MGSFKKFRSKKFEKIGKCEQIFIFNNLGADNPALTHSSKLDGMQLSVMSHEKLESKPIMTDFGLFVVRKHHASIQV